MLTMAKLDCRLIDAELDRWFGKQAPALPFEAQRHLDDCQRCRKLYSFFSEAAPVGNAPRGLELRVTQAIKGSLKPVSPLPSGTAIAAELIVAFLLFSAMIISVMTASGFVAMNLLQLAGIGAILALGVLLLGSSLAEQMTPGSLQRIPARAAAVILLTGLIAGIVLLFPWRIPEAFAIRGWRCLRAGLILAVPATPVFGFFVRRGVFLSLRTFGATLGAMAGLLSVTMLQFSCELQNIPHLLVWHVGVLAISTAVGAIAGEFVFRFRSNAPAARGKSLWTS
jgi:hypothetical protein